MNPSEVMPDPDAIKMFVGQVPKAWSENDVRMYFQEWGQIYLVNVLRDKVTKLSRGCCFITYYKRKSALEAQNACHNLRTLPGMNHPIQMKPADNENRAERKIFVGMISKKMNEMDLRTMFCRFGLIEECSILRDSAGQSRGCGFVTFSSKACALNAIKTMHHSTTMEGCSSPLVVKFADVQRDKVTKDAVALLQTLADPTSIQKSQYLPVLHMLQQGTCALAQATGACHPSPTTPSSTSPVPINPSSSSLGYPPSFGSFSTSAHHHHHQSPAATVTSDLATLTFLANLASHSQHSHSGGGGNANNGGSPNPKISTATGFITNSSNGGSSAAHIFPAQIEGPDGANLFIYHLPQEFTDADLIQTFLPFGSILSAKVFVDKQTNLSKCFGFVSYDNAISAHLAIQAMNGFQVYKDQIGPKRLKVQLKRMKDKPY